MFKVSVHGKLNKLGVSSSTATLTATSNPTTTATPTASSPLTLVANVMICSGCYWVMECLSVQVGGMPLTCFSTCFLLVAAFN